MTAKHVSVVIPCRDEAGSIAAVVSRVPAGMECIVVDNGSIDGTGEVAAASGARVIDEPRPGYGAAVIAGIAASTADVICTVDGDGSLDPAELPTLLAHLDKGADLVVGRRRPVSVRSWPVHARLGSLGTAWYLRHRHGLPVHDIGPVRVAARSTLLELGRLDPESGYPVELLVRAAERRLSVVECDVRYSPRTAGQSKVSGSLAGSYRAARDFVAALS
ncbi:glycosyltransferase family 2 protein [Gordonia sp. CPCC 205515]|uniref:glycosyltransferase family 2 protein n=1 Tax=Gordonia sp. CPCC 205515 TaxID=3140791 RepID=UPI003AF34DDF